MSYGLWLSAAGLQVNEYRQSLAANNMANADTVGFKRDLALIHQRRTESDVNPMQRPHSEKLLDAMTGGIWVRPTYTAFEQGELEPTNNNLDVALAGDGFFNVSDGTRQLYTRDGRFTLTSTGQMVMVAGNGRFGVLDESGAPIVADPAGGKIRIVEDGTIYQGRDIIGRLGISDVEDRTALRKVGTNAFENLGQSPSYPAYPKVLARHVERSTVRPVDALAGMIEVSRAYELNARMISLQDETIGQAVNRVGRVG